MSLFINPKSIAFAFDDTGIKLVGVAWAVLVLVMGFLQ